MVDLRRIKKKLGLYLHLEDLSLAIAYKSSRKGERKKKSANARTRTRASSIWTNEQLFSMLYIIRRLQSLPLLSGAKELNYSTTEEKEEEEKALYRLFDYLKQPPSLIPFHIHTRSFVFF